MLTIILQLVVVAALSVILWHLNSLYRMIVHERQSIQQQQDSRQPDSRQPENQKQDPRQPDSRQPENPQQDSRQPDSRQPENQKQDPRHPDSRQPENPQQDPRQPENQQQDPRQPDSGNPDNQLQDLRKPNSRQPENQQQASRQPDFRQEENQQQDSQGSEFKEQDSGAPEVQSQDSVLPELQQQDTQQSPIQRQDPQQIVNESDPLNISQIETSEGSSQNETVPKTIFVPSGPPKEYNILLLGESGAGKSTTINAFANYLQYSSFKEAIENKFIQLIPSSFTLPDPVSGEPRIYQAGSDSNEKFADEKGEGHGNSVTQSPVGYTFNFGEQLIRIIDTPGVGDTRGVEADKENFNKILSYLQFHKELHGICILMKSTDARKNTTFRYCINELLTHLHKSACRNIVFCFTFSRNSFYGPGEGFATLKSFLEMELNGIGLEMKKDVNCFFIDNEAFRFIVARNQGYPMDESQEKSYQESWNKSTQQTERMMKHIIGLEPHSMNDTVCLNSARKIILELADPMVRLQKNAQENIDHIKTEKDKLLKCNEDKEKLALNLYLEVDDLESRMLKYPTTVCCKCVEVITVNGKPKINYYQRCHENCLLTETQTNTIGHPALKGCAAIEPDGVNCTECDCHWQQHMHIYCEYIKIKRTIIDKSTERQIKSIDAANEVIENALDIMRMSVDEYQHELDVIQEISSKFAYILTANANTVYNKFIEPYLDLQIDEEKQKVSAFKDYPRTMLDALVQMKATHQKSVEILTKAIQDKSQDEVKLDDIEPFRERLLNLKHSGPQFKKFLQTTHSSQLVKLANMDKKALDVTVGVDSGSLGKLTKSKNAVTTFFTGLFKGGNQSTSQLPSIKY